MSITGGAVLFVVIWFMVLFLVLQVTARTQDDAGEVVPGTHASAPHDFRLGRTLLIATLIAAPIWAIIAWIILSGWITVEDLDWMDVLDERTPN